MAEKVRFVIERQDGPNEKPYTQEFDVDYRPGLNVVASLMEIQKNPVTVDGKKVSVQVGSVAHPMTDAHLIQWIYLQTKKGGQYVHLTAADKPEAEFIVADGDEPIAAYEFCNLHGLWKADIA